MTFKSVAEKEPKSSLPDAFPGLKCTKNAFTAELLPNLCGRLQRFLKPPVAGFGATAAARNDSE